jgi:CheY-like chemotaxis protein
MIVYFAADLLWSTRIQGTGKQVGIPCRPVRSVEMLRARLADSDVRAVIVDLDGPETALELIRALRGDPPLDPERKIRIVAFGPHVAVELFEQARAAGADSVLARGAFDRRLPELLAELDAA